MFHESRSSGIPGKLASRVGETSIFAVDSHYFIISTNIVPEHDRSLYANIDLQRLTKDVVSICRVRIN